MSEPQHRWKWGWTAVAALTGVALLVVGWVGGWKTSVATDAAFHQRVESFMMENADDRALINENRQNIAVLVSKMTAVIDTQKASTDETRMLNQQVGTLLILAGQGKLSGRAP